MRWLAILSLLAAQAGGERARPPADGSSGLRAAGLDQAVVAVVGGKVITREALEKRLALELFRRGEAVDSALVERVRRELLLEVVKKMVEDYLVLEEALRTGGRDYVTGAQVDARVQQLVQELRKNGSPIATPDGYFRAMQERFGLSREEERQRLRDEMVIGRYLWERVFRKVDTFVSPSESRHYYRTHLEEFTKPRKVAFRQILVREDRLAPLVLQKIEEGLEKGIPFEELARQYSQDFDDPELRGRLFEKDFSEVEQWVPPLPEVLRRLNPGEVSKPVRTERGIHYIKLESREEGTPVPFEEALPEIQKKIVETRRREAYDRLIAELRAVTPVEILLAGAQEDKPPAAGGGARSSDAPRAGGGDGAPKAEGDQNGKGGDQNGKGKETGARSSRG